MSTTKMLAMSLVAAVLSHAAMASDARSITAPQYKVDYTWPQLPLPNKWALGEMGGIFVDDKDNVWIINRPGTLDSWEKAAAANPPTASCCIPAPPVIQFDPSGKVVRAWGGPGQGYDWPQTEHGIAVDRDGNVWVGGSAARREKGDGMVLKFTPDGKFLMQIGRVGSPPKGSQDDTQVFGAADIAFSPDGSELFVADGYGNHRVAVFDAKSGKFKRGWGAYGKPATDENIGRYDPSQPPAQQFRNVHCVKVARDGMVYVCDRDNDRMQVFKPDGTFVAEYIYGKDTREPGTVGHISFWPDAQQSILALADLGNFQIRFVRRDNPAEVLNTLGTFGNYSGQFNRLHQAVFDSKGNIYGAEAAAKRVQKFTLVSGGPGR